MADKGQRLAPQNTPLAMAGPFVAALESEFES
jgi:hypothetical protein